MATIVLLHHGMYRHIPNNYIARLFTERWRESGHAVHEHFGAENVPAGDVLFLHVDLTVIPDEYRALFPRYRRVINGAVLDISKHTFSQNLVARDSDWNGPVIVKTDANYFGRPEWIVHSVARSVGAPADRPSGPWLQDYSIFGSPRDVPEQIWQTQGLIVEKFLPERDERGYYLRSWTFLGDRERGQRMRSEFPVIKRDNVIERESAPAPDEIRAWRERLGFDYGKFDYVIHQGRPILLDTNRTPGARTANDSNRGGRDNLLALADGLRMYLR